MEEKETNHFATLLKRHLDGACTKEELAALAEWAKNHPEQLRNELKSYWENILSGSNTGNRMFEKIMEQAQELENADEAADPKVISINKPGRRWLSIAAAVLLVIAGGAAWYAMNQKQTATKEAISQVQTQEELFPGGNKATLTLADGSTIVLDSANTGTITQQGNVTVIKLDDGKIAYDKKNDAGEVLYNTVRTPRGGQYQLVLADGTKVWLNAASSLKYPTSFSGNKREVVLTGEGYFEVAHNAGKPFFVKIGDMDIHVLGTHFNVNAYGDKDAITTTLLKGSVNVHTNHGDITIKPGQQTEVENGFIKLNNGVNLEAVVAWKNGIFLFDRADIYTVMNQIKRWYDLDVEYNGKVTQHFGGTIPRNVNAAELFKMLEMTGGVHFKIDGKKITVMP